MREKHLTKYSFLIAEAHTVAKDEISTLKKLTPRFWIVFVLTCATGLVLAKIDTSKGWDDTAVTVGLVLISSFLAGVVLPRFAWLWAINLTAFIFIFNAVESNNYQSAGALVFGLIGAYCGLFFAKVVYGTPSK
jgi:phosphoglycerol transferase MdoB-like AlkP superfamily enzyme